VYPLGTLELPYKCADPSCPCRGNDEPDPRRLAVRRGEHWTVEVREDGWIVDSFSSRELNEALEMVHREYPGIAFNPEA